MSNIIDKIRVSGTDYTLSATSSGGNPTVELTQAEYDALVSAGTVSADTYYIITDAQAGDLTQYWTSAQTSSAITQATSGKQDTLVSGTNIKTINNESLLGSGNIVIQGGGGSSYSAGTNIDITNDIISCTLNASNGNGAYSFKEGWATYAQKRCAHAEGEQTLADGAYSHAEGAYTKAYADYSHAEGYNTNANNQYEHASGLYNNSVSASTTFGDSGNTLFSVGNGTADNARHNAFEIRQNGDIYLSSGGTDIKLQDHLGGGGGGGVNVVQTTGTSTTDVMSQNAATSNFIYDINLNYKFNGRDTLALQGKGKNLFIPYMTINGKKVLSINDLSVVETSAVTSAVTSSSTDDEIPTAKAVYDAIPTVPTSASQLTNDIGYITSGDAQTQIDNSISGKVDTTTFNTYSGNVETSLSGKQDTLSAGTGIDITDNVISATGGGSTYTAGRGIDITSNAISISLPISAGTGSLSIAENNDTVASGMWSHAEGAGSSATSYASHAEGKFTEANGDSSHAEGSNTEAKNFAEHASGRYNASSSASTTFGDSGNTLFSVGNGTASDARHNAFEIRQNGDIYLSNGTNDVKLQDYIQIKAVKISQSDYDQLQTKDPNTLYIITTT